MVTFDQRVVLNFDFNAHSSLVSVQKAVRRVTPLRGATCTGNAIKYVYENILGNLTSGKEGERGRERERQRER